MRLERGKVGPFTSASDTGDGRQVGSQDVEPGDELQIKE